MEVGSPFKWSQSVGCKLIFRSKNDAIGKVVCYKARLVAKRFLQLAKVDFYEIFALVAKFNNVMCILAIGATFDSDIHQMDIKTIFLLEIWWKTSA